MPPLVATVCDDINPTDEQFLILRAALDRKDTATVQALAADIGEEAAAMLLALMNASGPVGSALKNLSKIDLPSAAAAFRSEFEEIIATIMTRSPDLSLTIDTVENRGFEYHTGITYTLFARGVSGELGRGGRYPAPAGDGTEPATGFSLFMDTVLRARGRKAGPDRLSCHTAQTRHEPVSGALKAGSLLKA